MTTEILIGLIIVALLGYITYLHIRLARKDIFIESTVKKLSGIENNWSAEEMMRFLQEIRKISHYNSFFADKLFEEKPLKFLMEYQKDSRIYIHYTREKADAGNIVKEGFRFTDSFYKTALPVSDDRLDLLIKHNGRKSFGEYMVILCISDKVFDHYASELDREDLKDYAVENVLSELPPCRNENGDLNYLLSNRFVKGFINHQTGEIYPNSEFNREFNSEKFEKNIVRLKGEIDDCPGLN